MEQVETSEYQGRKANSLQVVMSSQLRQDGGDRKSKLQDAILMGLPGGNFEAKTLTLKDRNWVLSF